MGRVWRAHHTALKTRRCLKVIPDAFAADPERVARFAPSRTLLNPFPLRRPSPGGVGCSCTAGAGGALAQAGSPIVSETLATLITASRKGILLRAPALIS
jgi:hypothetical protein